MPVEALNLQLSEGPVMLGPLDMGELPYHPSARGANGVDHFVLALHTEDGAVVVQDPAGYPAMPIDVEALDRAWWADLIEYRRGAYRRWHSPSRAEDPSPEQIAGAAIQSFGQAYRDSRTIDDPKAAVGSEAVEALVATIRGGELLDSGLEHLRRFALPLGVRTPSTTPGTCRSFVQSWLTSRKGRHGILPVSTSQRPGANGNLSRTT